MNTNPGEPCMFGRGILVSGDKSTQFVCTSIYYFQFLNYGIIRAAEKEPLFMLALRLFACVGTMLICRFAGAATIVASITSGQFADDGPAIGTNSFAQESWTQTQTYTDVLVTATLDLYYPGLSRQGSFVAYLTNCTGSPCTPPPLASALYTVYSSDTWASQQIQLFSGLTLGPGTYYLTLAGSGGFGFLWSSDYSGSVTAPGVTIGPEGFTSVSFPGGPPGSSNDAFPPGSAFVPAPLPVLNYLVFSATSVPEASTFYLLSVGLFAFALRKILGRSRM